MNGKKQYWLIFLRTLAAFLAFWLLMVMILTVQNRESNFATLDQKLDQVDMLADNVQIVLDGTATPGKKPTIITNRLYTNSVFRGADLSVYRVYDDQLNELGRSQIAYGSFTLPGTFTYSHYILFDRVLTDEEQIALARLLREDNYRLNTFYGSAYAEWGEAPNMGLYGEITGILDETTDTVIPKKLVYYYEDHELVLVDSDHEMFEGAELTTLRFDSAQISSALSWDGSSPKKLLKLYKQAQAKLDEIMEERTSINGSSTYRYDDWHGRFSSESGIGIARVSAYTPWKVATYGLWFTCVATFLAALLAAVITSRIQIKSLKKERQFTRSVAHELKTPAAVLRAYAETLEEDAVPEKRQEYLNAIVEESDRMAVLVNELLDLSRMEGSAMAIAEEQVDLTALVLARFERMSVPLHERALEVEVDLHPVVVKGDSKRLAQVVNNLAVNVLNHAAPGPVRVKLKWEQKYAVLTVENRCEPIPEEKLKRLWEPFYKVDESRSGEGSGLGLAVVKNIVELHGGTCRAESLPDGILFCIELPC